MAAGIDDGETSLQTLILTPPPSYIIPCPNLSNHARLASRHLYSVLFPSCPNPKPPLNDLLIDDSFDAEQIWSQTDLLSRPLLSLLKKEIKKIERDPPLISGLDSKKDEIEEDEEEKNNEEENEEIDDEEEEEEEEEEAEEEEEEAEEEDEENEKEGNNELEDRFFKVRELEEFLAKDEEREFGSVGGGKKGEEEDDDENDDNAFDLLVNLTL